MNLLIKFFEPVDIKKGHTILSGKYYDEVAAIFSLEKLDVRSIKQTLGVSVKRIDKDVPAHFLQIIDVINVNNTIEITWRIKGISCISSEEVKKDVYHFLFKENTLKKQESLPIWTILNDESFNFGLKYKTITESNTNNIMNNSVQYPDFALLNKIYDLHLPVEKLKNTDMWNEPYILRDIGFACGKLAETYTIPEDVKYDLFKKNDYLIQKKHLRDETIELKKRCVELDGENPIFLSDLACLFYQNVIELTQKGGRRDGNVLIEMEEAVKYFNESLKLNPSRTIDFFRKGYLLAVKLTDILSSGSKYSMGYVDKVNKVNEGIESLEKVVKLCVEPETDKEGKKKYSDDFKFIYVKALLFLGKAYEELIINDWNEIEYILGLYNDKSFYLNSSDVNLIESSIKYYNEYILVSKNSNKVGLIEDKETLLYGLGKAYIKLYRIRLGTDLIKESDEALNNAEKCFIEILNEKDSGMNKKKNVAHIAERLAKVYIIQGRYDDALNVLNRHMNNKYDLAAYIVNTRSLAYIMNNNNDDAISLLEPICKDKNNKSITTSVFLLAVAYLGKKDTTAAGVLLKKAVRKEDRIKAKEVLYLGLAETERRSGNVKDAFVYYKKVEKSLLFGHYIKLKLQELNEYIN